MTKRYITIIMAAVALGASAQQTISLEAALQKAVRDYPALRAARLKANSLEAMKKSVSPFGELDLSGGGEEIGHGNDAVYTLARVRQNIDPFSVKGKRAVLDGQAGVAKAEEAVAGRDLARRVATDYINDYAARLRWMNMLRSDSLYADFEEVARKRYELKDISLLEYQAAKSYRQQVGLSLREAARDMEKAHVALSQWLSADTLFMATAVDTTLANVDDEHAEHPVHQLMEQRALLSEANLKELRSRMAPKLFVEAGLQKIGPRSGYYAWQAGVSIPMNFGAHKSTMKAARIAQQQVQAENEDLERQHSTKHLMLLADIKKFRQSTDYYVQTALPLAQEQQRIALISYRARSIGYLDFIQATEQALRTEMGYVETLTQLLQTKYELMYY